MDCDCGVIGMNLIGTKNVTNNKFKEIATAVLNLKAKKLLAAINKDEIEDIMTVVSQFEV